MRIVAAAATECARTLGREPKKKKKAKEDIFARVAVPTVAECSSEKSIRDGGFGLSAGFAESFRRSRLLGCILKVRRIGRIARGDDGTGTYIAYKYVCINIR